jgi:hypothetical protein
VEKGSKGDQNCGPRLEVRQLIANEAGKLSLDVADVQTLMGQESECFKDGPIQLSHQRQNRVPLKDGKGGLQRGFMPLICTKLLWYQWV